MLRKIKLLLKVPINIKINQRNISALYITGDKASENFSVLKPYFDFKRLQNLEELQKNCENRRVPIDIETLKEHWELYKSIEEKKLILENRRKKISDEIKDIQNQSSTIKTTTKQHATNTPAPIENPLIEALKTEGITVREDLKLLKENTYQIDKEFITKFLHLPNVLHKHTPINNEEIIIDSYFDDERKGSENKMDNSISKQMNIDQLQEHHNPKNYYLKGEAAKFELFIPLNCIEFYQQSAKFIPISNPDFIKTVIVEGAAHKITDFYQILDDDNANQDNLDLNDDDDESINEHQRINNLHLIGSGSWLSYLGFITKLIVQSNVLPLKLITNGKRYNCEVENDSDPSIGLDSIRRHRRQETIVQIFMADLNEEKTNQTFNEVLEKTIEYYKTFKRHFRIVYVPAHKLHASESLRISFQMFANGEYQEIGHLSQHNDFISKRLLFICKEGKKIHFPYIITGNILNVNNLLEILCENNQNIAKLSEFYQ